MAVNLRTVLSIIRFQPCLTPGHRHGYLCPDGDLSVIDEFLGLYYRKGHDVMLRSCCISDSIYITLLSLYSFEAMF